MAGEQLGDRPAVGAHGGPRGLIPLKLHQADSPLGQRAGRSAEHIDLEPLHVYLQTVHPAVANQRVDGDQFRHRGPVHREAVARVEPAGEPGGSAMAPGGRLDGPHLVPVERDVLAEQAERVRGRLNGDDLGAEFGRQDRVAAHVGPNVDEEPAAPQRPAPHEHLRQVGRVRVDDLRGSRAVRVDPEQRPLAEPGHHPPAQQPHLSLVPDGAKNRANALPGVGRVAPDEPQHVGADGELRGRPGQQAGG